MSDTYEIINCPACGKRMHKVFMESGKCSLDVCIDGCGGIFFDGQELKKFDEQHENIEELKKAIENKNFESTDETQTRVCPVCGNNMVKNYVSAKKQIQIDECYNCGAKFFDHGELTKMREEYATEEDRRQDFLSQNYNDVGMQIEMLDLNNKINYEKRSRFLKTLDRFFFR